MTHKIFTSWWPGILLTVASFCYSPFSYALECGYIDNVQELPSSAVWQAIDGDTVHINNKHKIRLNQANAPELANQHGPDQPHAQAAKQAVQTFFSQDAKNTRVFWLLKNNTKDMYWRYLGKLYNAQGQWLAAHLVHEGLAFAISFSRDPAPACLWELELAARKAKRGIWSSDLAKVVSAAQAEVGQGGFMRLSGRVKRVDTTRNAWFVELDGSVVLRIQKRNWVNEGGTLPTLWQDQQVLARGWLGFRQLSAKQLQQGYKPRVMHITHPDMFKILH